ncbi:hypothetical protein ACHAXS_002133 [Conticribra weissflogii]
MQILFPSKSFHEIGKKTLSGTWIFASSDNEEVLLFALFNGELSPSVEKIAMLVLVTFKTPILG